MSLRNKIEYKVKEIIDFNRIEVKTLIVKEETVLTERKYKRERVYKIKIIFSKVKNPLDYFVILTQGFIFRFKLYRAYHDNNDNSLNYYLKLRDIDAFKNILED